MAEVRKGIKKPCKNLEVTKTDKLEVKAQTTSQIIKRALPTKARYETGYFSLRMPDGMLPNVIPAKSKEIDREA